MHRLKPLVPLIAAVLLCAILGLVVQRGGADDRDARLLHIRRTTEKIRGLQLRSDVPVRRVPYDQLKRFVNSGRNRPTRARCRADLLFLRLTGAIGPRDSIGPCEASPRPAFYDHDTKTIWIDSGLDDDPAWGSVMAHEYVHAIQDQWFDMNHLLPIGDLELDRRIGGRALIEGDAMLVQQRYAELTGEPVSQRDDGRIPALTTPAATIDAAYGQFPYDAGYWFVTAIRTRGGWDGVNATLRAAPPSSRDVALAAPDDGSTPTRPLPAAPARPADAERLADDALGAVDLINLGQADRSIVTAFRSGRSTIDRTDGRDVMTLVIDTADPRATAAFVRSWLPHASVRINEDLVTAVTDRPADLTV